MKSIKLFVLILFLVAAFAFQTQAQESKNDNNVFIIVEDMPDYLGVKKLCEMTFNLN